MAKKELNKSEAIRNALKADPNKSPSEIAEALQAKGVKVNAQYVSVVKSSMKTKRKKATQGRKTARGGKMSNGSSPLTAALNFIRAAGGLKEAKETLSTVEEISRTVR
jgi:hypothetical protein